MIIEILQSKLKEGLSIVGRASSKSTTLPVLKNILIKSKDNALELSSTDLEIGIRWRALAKTKKEGAITVPFSVLSGFVNLLPPKKIKLAQKGDVLFVECEDYKTQINGMGSGEFPIIPETERKRVITVDAGKLCEGLSQIIDIPSLSRVKPEISGVFFTLQNEEAMAVATDSYRLAERKIFLKKKTEGGFSFIIPQKAAREIINIFKEQGGDMEIIFGENQVLFSAKTGDSEHLGCELTSKLIEGEYPDYKSIIPSSSQTQVVLSRDEFLNRVKAGSVFGGKVNEVGLVVDPEKGEVMIKSENTDLGVYEAKVPGRVNGEKTEVSFNYRFLLDGLLNIKSSEIMLELSGESKPGVLRPVGRDDFLYVVMPIRGN